MSEEANRFLQDFKIRSSTEEAKAMLELRRFNMYMKFRFRISQRKSMLRVFINMQEV